MDIWFWQLIVSPHMAGLAKALAEQGHSVTFVAQKEMSIDRAAQGWVPPGLGAVNLVLAPDGECATALAESSPQHAIHICQGIRANGVVGDAQRVLKKLRRRQLVVMEAVDDQGKSGCVKKAVYRWLFNRWMPHLMGVLAIGSLTKDWIVARGVPERKVFPFAYFLPISEEIASVSLKSVDGKFRILFVGQFIELKRLDLLITALSQTAMNNIELVVVGSGPLESQLKALAEKALPGQVDWRGRLPMKKVRGQMARSDCLVLPSRHDGWGAVVSEALMSGTPAICSDTCGSSVVVLASGHGGVFESGNVDALRVTLENCISEGKLSDAKSRRLAVWASCLGEEEGARYLGKIISAINGGGEVPTPPWFVNG